jgi:death-on-curing protein
LVQNHLYRDGNKRIGFLAVVTFLGINGQDLRATDAEVVTEIVALADGSVAEDDLAQWIRGHSGRRR